MDQDTIRKYQELFSAGKLKKAYSKYIWYLFSLIARCIYEEEPYLYGDYFAAISSKKAAPLLAYLDGKPKTHEEAFFLNALAAIDGDRFGLEFITELIPELFLGDATQVFDYLQQFRGRDSLRNNIYLNFKILAVLRFRLSLYRDDEYPISVTRFQPEVFSSILYSRYQRWDQYSQFSKLVSFGQEEFYRTWLLMNGSFYAPDKIKVPLSLAKPIRNFRKEGTPEESIIRVFYAVKCYQALDPKKIDMPIAYLKKVFLSDAKQQLLPDVSPGERLFVEDENLDRALKMWKKTDSVDFVRALQFADSAERIALESSIVLPQILGKAERTLLVEPNPDFLMQLLQSNLIDLQRIMIAFTCVDILQIYKLQFPNIRMAFMDCQSEQPLSLTVQEIDALYPGKGKRFLSLPLNSAFDRIVFFVRPSYEDKVRTILEGLESLVQFTPKTNVLLFAPHTLLDNKDYGISAILDEKYSVRWITLCPRDTVSSGQKKNLLVLCRTSKSQEERNISVVRSSLYSWDENRKIICQDPWGIAVPGSVLLRGNKTINYQWENYRPRPDKRGLRVGDRRVEFSKEIWIWYSWSKGRGRYGFHKCPTEKQLHENPLPRGKRLTENQYSAKTIELAEEYIRFQLLNSPELRKIIAGEILEHYKFKALSLKTYWYCHIDDFSDNPQYRAAVAEEMFSESERLSGIMSDKSVSLQEYQEIMESDFTNRSASETLIIWQQLNIILRLGSREGRFSPNPISEYLAALKERDKGYKAARDALAKRSYSLEEERKMLAFIKAQLPENGLAAGCAISFYTGMAVNEICALTWNDFRQVKDADTWQLWVYKKTEKNELVKAFGSDDLFSFRRVPCVKPLAEILLKRRELLLSKCEGDESALSLMPIVSGDEEDISVYCRAAVLRKAKDDTENAAGIVSISGIVRYTDELEKQTDFNEYQSDRFRSNFSYRALQTCAMSRAELNYILGKTPPTTFSKHYCDYTNDFSQLVLARKLERWVGMHQSSKKTAVKRAAPFAQGIKWPNTKNGSRYAASIDITIYPDKNDSSAIDVTVSSSRGADIEIYKF